jgi:CDGSH-type Zn-finger protein
VLRNAKPLCQFLDGCHLSTGFQCQEEDSLEGILTLSAKKDAHGLISDVVILK